MSYITSWGHKWIPYFGNQKRFVDFVVECLNGLDLESDFTFYETNSGSHAVSHHVRKKLGVNTVSNDISRYSQAVGLALTGNPNWTPASENRRFLSTRFGGELCFIIDKLASSPLTSFQAASLGCLLLEAGGYDLKLTGNEEFDYNRFIQWRDFFKDQAILGGKITRLDLTYFLKTNKGQVVYMDFAWPWKDGHEVEEYGTMMDIVSSALSQTHESFELWTRENVVRNVLDTCALAVKNFTYVILSNQSSNYPTWDILESALEEDNRFNVIGMRRLTLPAEDVDNRGIENWFTEYQYILTE